MLIGRVIGSLWATRKHSSLESGRFVMVQPLDEFQEATGDPLAALDTIGSGVGDLVLYITSYEAALPWFDRHPDLKIAGVDASVIGVIDRVAMEEETP